MTCGLGAALLFALAAAPAAPQDEKKDPQEDYRKKTEKHRKTVTSLRGLEFKKDVTVGAYSKQELLDFLKEELDREFPREKAERFQRAYAKFGLLPEDMDLYDALMKLFGSSIAGFYHPKTKELRLIKPGEEKDPEAEAMKALGMDMEAITLVHELTHAAQDQNFELSTLPLDDETNDDLILAIKSVIEGDANLVGWKFALKERFEAGIGLINAQFKTGQLPGEAASLPAYLRLSLTFPYGYGGDFVLKGVRNSPGGLKDISRLLKDFPLSSEQILHPAKYYEERDNPILVTLPDLAKLFGAPWKESVNNVHGEFSIGLLLREFKGDDLTFADARRASEGWGGDRYVTLEDDKKRVMYVWYTAWDTMDDAVEFFKAYATALTRKHKAAGEKPENDTSFRFESRSGLVHMERKGADVLVFDGATPDMLRHLDTIWRGAKKSEIKGFERLKLFVCEKDGVKESFSGPCPKCGKELVFKDDKEPPKKPEKKKREY
jgi:hypothetical protein